MTDIDELAKTVLDGIQEGIAWHDPQSCQTMSCTDDHDNTAAKEALAELVEQLKSAKQSMNYISAPTMAYPGSAIDADTEAIRKFVLEDGPEREIRLALLTCISMARGGYST